MRQMSEWRPQRSEDEIDTVTPGWIGQRTLGQLNHNQS